MPTFNYDAARRAGYSDQQIQDFVKQKGLTVNRDQQEKKPSFFERVGDFLGVKEFGQGLGQAASQLSGDVRGARKSEENLRQINERLIRTALKKPIGDPDRTRMLQQAQQTSQGQSQRAETQASDVVTNKQFLGSAAVTGLNVVGAGMVPKGKFVADVARFGGLGGAMGAAESVRQEDKTTMQTLARIGTGALVGAVFPSLAAAKRGVGKLTQATGHKIGASVIRPSSADVADGFNVQNVYKYNLGGSLKQTLEKTTGRMNRLSDDLNKTLTSVEGKPVDLEDLYRQTEKYFTGHRQLQNFGNSSSIKRTLDGLKEEIFSLFPDDKSTNLYNATLIKRGAGTKGAWVFGSPDPDATATQKVYTKFYQIIKKAIEDNSPDSLKGINRELSDLIPIQNAVIRRIPIAERNNILGLTSNMGLYASVFDPRALIMVGGHMLSTSGRFGNTLSKIGSRLQKMPQSELGQGLRGVGRTGVIRGAVGAQ